jgi:hypothetical protein
MRAMRRTLGSMGAWFLATGLAVLVAWLGVRSVLFAAVPDRASPMSAAEARQVVPQTQAPTAGGGAPLTATPTATPNISPSPTESEVAGATPSSTPSPTASAWIEVPDGKGGVAQVGTVETLGGSARIRFTETDVRVIAAEPEPGYAATFAQQAAAVLTVTFTSASHVSKITAFWERGARARISEAPSG